LKKGTRVMPVNSPLPTDTRSRLADWLEVLALTTSRGVATRADVLSLHDLLGDETREVENDESTGELLESEILDDERSSATDAVFEELARRSEILGLYYPFTLESRGQSWRLAHIAQTESDVSTARAFYIFCLLTSAVRDRRIHGAAIPHLETAMPSHFQLIATEAAAEVVGGIAISFGWPRPEGTAFQPALKNVSQRLRLGTPLDTVPLWSTGREKDSGIDVIAWREFTDGRPGKLILLGQVASGNNWTGKSVKSDTPRFLSWFSQRPTEHYIPAIFIPFPQHHDCTGRRDADFEAVAREEAWLREQEFGLVIDRLRVVESAAKHFAEEFAGRAVTPAGLTEWITQALDAAKAAA
jgi:hypothetical protein